MNSWIADISLHKKLGKFIKAFKDKEDLMRVLFQARARMKMYVMRIEDLG